MRIQALAGVFDPRGRLGSRAADGLRAAFSPGEEWADAHLAVIAAHGMSEADPGRVVAVDGDERAAGRAASGDASTSTDELARPFALVHWTSQQRRGGIVRDPSGFRGMYAGAQDGRLYFATGLRELLSVLPAPPRPAMGSLAVWIAGEMLPLGSTLYEGVFSLPAAHRLVLGAGGWQAQRYWRPRRIEATRGLDDDAAAAALHDAIHAAVDRALDGAQRPGLLLSGGLDSGAVLAVAARSTSAARLHAFSGVLPDYPDIDEGSFIDAALRSAETTATKVPISSGGLADGAERFLALCGTPADFPGAFHFLPVTAAAQRQGCDVLLDGEGGDELFGCEPLLIADRLLAGRWISAARIAREVPGMGKRLDPAKLRIVLRSMLLRELVPPIVDRVRRRRGISPPPDWLTVPVTTNLRARWPRRPPLWRSHLQWVLTTSRDLWAAQDVLRNFARLAGVRSAHPFLDAGLVEAVLNLPPQLAFDRHRDRALLRRSLEGELAEEIRLRDGKSYFQDLGLDSLTGPDHDRLQEALSGPLLLEPLVDSRRLRQMVAAGPDGHARGAPGWVAETWRAFGAERFLAQAGGRERC